MTGTPLNEVWRNGGGIASVTTDHQSLGMSSYAPYPDAGKQAPFPPAQSLPGGIPMHPLRAIHPDLIPSRGGDYPPPDPYSRSATQNYPPSGLPPNTASYYHHRVDVSDAYPDAGAPTPTFAPRAPAPHHSRRVRGPDYDFRAPSTPSESTNYTAPVAVVALALCVFLALLLMGSYFWSARLTRELGEVRQMVCVFLSQRANAGGAMSTALPPYYPPSPYPSMPDPYGRAQAYPLSPLNPNALRN